jgi:hypothetical protein
MNWAKPYITQAEIAAETEIAQLRLEIAHLQRENAILRAAPDAELANEVVRLGRDNDELRLALARANDRAIALACHGLRAQGGAPRKAEGELSPRQQRRRRADAAKLASGGEIALDEFLRACFPDKTGPKRRK